MQFVIIFLDEFERLRDREVVSIREKLADHPLLTPVDDSSYNACVLLLRFVSNDGY